MIILKIAFRNLLEHKAKTAIVGSLIAFAVIFMVAGNSVLASIQAGLKKSYSANYTGDLIVHGISEDNFSLIAMGGAAGGDIPRIPQFVALRKAAEEFEHTAAVLPLVSGSASISVDEETGSFTQLWGTDFDDYRKMFPDSIEIIEGGFPAEDGAYILLSETVKAETEKELGKPIAVGEKITLGGFGSVGTKLREAKIAGFFRFRRNSDQIERISLIDANTLRSLKGMTASAGNPADGTTGTTPSQEISEDDLFGDSGSLVTAEPAASASGSTGNLENILGDTSVRSQYSIVDPDAWNFLLVRLTDGKYYDAAKKTIDAEIERSGAEAAVSDWQWAAGMVASIAVGIQLIFNIIIFIILVVAVIIIMNTLVISVTERIPEIGTIRAIGGSKSFVRRMITWETLVISIVSGLVGAAAGAALVDIINLIGIESSNTFFTVLFGGTTLHPVLSLQSVAWSLVSTVCIGVLSSLYPTAVALKISPLRAMQKN